MQSFTMSVSLPKTLKKEMDHICRDEHRSKSGLVQEALRHYVEMKKWSRLQREISVKARKLGIVSEDDVEDLVDEVRS